MKRNCNSKNKASIKSKGFISLRDFSAAEINNLLKSALNIKNNPGKYSDCLKGKSVGLVFEKASLRTKTAFYLGALQLGAQAVYYSPDEVKLGKREKVADAARTLSGYLDLVVLRTFSHESVLEFKDAARIPIVNGLSDLLHPSQALADMMTIIELKKSLNNLKIAYIGDGNNVCASLINAVSILGGDLTIASPTRYVPDKTVLSSARSSAVRSNAKIALSNCAASAAEGADVLYTDVWVSMGKEKESASRKKYFKNFKIDDTILNKAKRNCVVLHCLPAHRGEEITDSVIDGRNSAVFQQAENRLHTAKAILRYLLSGK